MARKLIWTEPALDDVEAIRAFIAQGSPYQAARVVQKIFAAAEAALDFPEAGRCVPEKSAPNLRERFVFSYRVIYRIGPDDLRIEAVIHGARLLDAALSDRQQ